MPGKEIPVLVVDAKIRGEPDVAVVAPPEVQAHVGDVLIVKFHFEFEEKSRLRESYAFELRSRLGQQEHSPTIVRFADRWARMDAAAGHLVQAYELKDAGATELSFSGTAAYGATGWRWDPATDDVRTVEGTLRLVVA